MKGQHRFSKICTSIRVSHHSDQIACGSEDGSIDFVYFDTLRSDTIYGALPKLRSDEIDNALPITLRLHAVAIVAMEWLQGDRLLLSLSKFCFSSFETNALVCIRDGVCVVSDTFSFTEMVRIPLPIHERTWTCDLQSDGRIAVASTTTLTIFSIHPDRPIASQIATYSITNIETVFILFLEITALVDIGSF